MYNATTLNILLSSNYPRLTRLWSSSFALVLSPGHLLHEERALFCDFMSDLLNKKQLTTSISTSNMSSTGEKSKIRSRISKERDECVGKTTTQLKGKFNEVITNLDIIGQIVESKPDDETILDEVATSLRDKENVGLKRKRGKADSAAGTKPSKSYCFGPTISSGGHGNCENEELNKAFR